MNRIKSYLGIGLTIFTAAAAVGGNEALTPISVNTTQTTFNCPDGCVVTPVVKVYCLHRGASDCTPSTTPIGPPVQGSCVAIGQLPNGDPLWSCVTP